MMIRPSPALLLLAAAAAALPACSADTSSGDEAIADLGAEVQRLRQESEKQRDRIAKLERQIGGLQTDVVRVREISGGVSEAHVAPGEAAATDGGPAGPAAGTGAVPDGQAMRTYFATEDGRKVLTAAMRIAQDQQEQERTARMVEGMLSRFAKDAELTEDQTRKMRDILGRSTGQMRELMISMRDPPADLTGDARDQARQQTMAKIGEVRQAADTEIKSVLSQTQYDAYQKSFPQGTGGFGDRGPVGPSRRAN